MSLKIKLIEVGKSQTDLLRELHKRGYPRLYPCDLSRYINGVLSTPQSEAVLKLSDKIIEEWREQQ